MSHRLNSFIAAVIFFAAVMATGFAFRILVPVLIVYTALLLAYNYRYLKQKHFYTFWTWIKPVLFLGASMAIYFAVPPGFARGFYLLLAAFLLLLFELGLSVPSEQLNFLQTLVTYFGLSLGIFAGQFYFLLKAGFVLAAIAVLTFLVARSSLDYVPANPARKNFSALLLTLAVLEIGWALTFLPFHFTALAVIMFNAFYAAWIVIYYHLYNSLSPKKIYFHLAFSGLLVLLAVLSTPWK